MSDQRPAQQTGLLRGLSSDEDARDRQLANLQPAAATRHGAHSPAARAELEARHRARQRELHPNVPDDAISAQTLRLAMAELYWQDIVARGATRGKRDISPASRELRLLLDAISRGVHELQALEREASKVDPNDLLRKVIAAEAAGAANNSGRDD